MGLIYMRTSPSGGRYIGKTVKTEKSRWGDHIYEAHDTRFNKNYNSLLNKAIRKYGGENFTVEILEDNIPDEELPDREKYWIAYYHTYYLDGYHGYNMTHGGDGCCRHRIEDFMPYWEKGYSIIEISRILKVRRQTVADYLHRNGVSQEEIDRRGIISQRKTAFSFNIEEVYELWNQGYTLTEIKQKFNLDDSNQSIRKVLQEFYNVSSKEILKRGRKRTQEKRKKPIYQYDKEGNLLYSWRCVEDAANFNQVSQTTIYNNLKGLTKFCKKKYTFSYLKKENDND